MKEVEISAGKRFFVESHEPSLTFDQANIRSNFLQENLRKYNPHNWVSEICKGHSFFFGLLKSINLTDLVDGMLKK